MSSSPDPTTDLLVVLGSTTKPGRLRRALDEAIARVVAGGGRAELLDLAGRQLAFADGRPPEALGDDTEAVVAAVAAADAVVFATPVYRGSMTAALKNVFDHLPLAALQGKPVGIVAMGARDHHYLGPDRHLRDVLSFFGAHVMPVSVYLTSGDFRDGAPEPAAAATLDELLSGLARLAAALDPETRLAGPAPLVARPPAALSR